MSIYQDWSNILTEISRYAIHTLDSITLPPNPVIVFDIDLTLLDNNNLVIKPIRVVYYYALMLGIKVVIITSRSGTKEVIELTRQQLNTAGITDISYWYFRNPSKYNNWSFKRKSRMNLHERGYNIVMSLGDQDWDIKNGYTGIGIKIPIIYQDKILYSNSVLEDHF